MYCRRGKETHNANKERERGREGEKEKEKETERKKKKTLSFVYSSRMSLCRVCLLKQRKSKKKGYITTDRPCFFNKHINPVFVFQKISSRIKKTKSTLLSLEQ